MSRDPERAASQFFGGRVCLDFANTLDWRLTDEPVELIPDYAALLAWRARRGILTLPHRVVVTAYMLRTTPYLPSGISAVGAVPIYRCPWCGAKIEAREKCEEDVEIEQIDDA